MPNDECQTAWNQHQYGTSSMQASWGEVLKKTDQVSQVFISPCFSMGFKRLSLICRRCLKYPPVPNARLKDEVGQGTFGRANVVIKLLETGNNK